MRWRREGGDEEEEDEGDERGDEMSEDGVGGVGEREEGAWK